MTSPLNVAVLVGSLRAASLNRRLFQHAARVAPDSMRLTELPVRDLPLYDEDLRRDETEAGYPDVVRAFRASLREADAVLLVTPEYNYSVPAPLSNALDWASRAPDKPFEGMPVAIMGASGGRLGTARMQYHLRQILVAMNAQAVVSPEVMVANARSEFGDGGTVQELTTELIVQLLESLERLTRAIRSR